MFNLLPYGSVLDNVLLPLSFAPKRRRRASQGGTIESEASRLLASLGLDPNTRALLCIMAIALEPTPRLTT